MVAPNTWAKVLKMINEHWSPIPNGTTIFEPACECHHWIEHEGKEDNLGQSILDHFHIVCCDLLPERGGTGHEWHQVDLNQPYEDWGFKPKQFDYAVAVEAIEHIENIYNFLRGLKYYTRREFIVTSPDILARESLLRALDGDGYFTWFHPNNFDKLGHINIAYTPHIRFWAEQNSCTVLEHTWNLQYGETKAGSYPHEVAILRIGVNG